MKFVATFFPHTVAFNTQYVYLQEYFYIVLMGLELLQFAYPKRMGFVTNDFAGINLLYEK